MAYRDRKELQDILEEILGSGKVYFQPPATARMEYPCIIYTLETRNIEHANNRPYRQMKRYLITVVDSNPDSTIGDRVAQLPTAQFGRSYKADQLNHQTFRVYF